MKFDELRRHIILDILKDWQQLGWIMNKDGSVDIKGDLVIPIRYQYSELPFKIGKIEGDLDCRRNGLETLKNFPDVVEGSIHCSNNSTEFTENEIRRITKCVRVYV